MDRIEDLQAFVTIVEKGSLTAAAKQLGRSLQSVSRSLAALESGLDIELVARTTRRSAPTEEGLAFYRRISAALSEIEAARHETSKRRAQASGLLRITSSTGFAPLHIVPAARAFLDLHPHVEIELDISDGFVDLVDRGFDLAIRTGDLPDSSLKARRIANFRLVVFGSPSYFSEHGRPKTPEDLARHQCIVRTAAREANGWPFMIAGRPRNVKVAGRFRASSSPATIEAAVQGLGLAQAPLWQVQRHVDSGALELVLTRFEPPRMPMHVVWPSTRLLPAKTQLFIEFLAERLKKERL